MPFFALVVIVLVAWGAGAAYGSAATYLAGALLGTVIVVVLLAFFGGIAGRGNRAREERGVRSA